MHTFSETMLDRARSIRTHIQNQTSLKARRESRRHQTQEKQADHSTNRASTIARAPEGHLQRLVEFLAAGAFETRFAKLFVARAHAALPIRAHAAKHEFVRRLFQLARVAARAHLATISTTTCATCATSTVAAMFVSAAASDRMRGDGCGRCGRQGGGDCCASARWRRRRECVRVEIQCTERRVRGGSGGSGRGRR